MLAHCRSLRTLAAWRIGSSQALLHPPPTPCCLLLGIPGGRRAFHGERELYMSDHTDRIHSATILGRCVVHSLEDYRVG